LRVLSQPRVDGLQARRLLVVAGPSASGKSRFLSALAKGALPAEVAARLPCGAEAWPQTNGRRIQRGRLPRRTRGRGPIEGLVLHYDILRPFRTAVSDYATDPALTMLRTAEAVMIIAMVAPNARLADQLAARPPRQRMLDPLTAVWRRWLGARTSAIYDKASEGERHRELVALYREADFLDSWWRRWGAYVRSAAPGDRLKGVVPVEAEGVAAPGYRLAEAPPPGLVAGLGAGTTPASTSNS
jgi:hypothetical protein